MRERFPTANRLRLGAPPPYMLACLALCALIAGFAVGDLVHTESRLPDGSGGCDPTEVACIDTRVSEQRARERAAEPLQDRYDSRAWVYSSAILAILALTLTWRLRSTSRRDWLRTFSDLGVIGVWLGIASVLLLLA